MIEWWIDLPEEFGSLRSHFNDSVGQTLSLVEYRRMQQFLFLDQATQDSGWHGGFTGRDDEPYTTVPGSSHRSTSRVHHEAHQEAAFNNSHFVSCVLSKINPKIAKEIYIYPSFELFTSYPQNTYGLFLPATHSYCLTMYKFQSLCWLPPLLYIHPIKACLTWCKLM